MVLFSLQYHLLMWRISKASSSWRDFATESRLERGSCYIILASCSFFLRLPRFSQLLPGLNTGTTIHVTVYTFRWFELAVRASLFLWARRKWYYDWKNECQISHWRRDYLDQEPCQTYQALRILATSSEKHEFGEGKSFSENRSPHIATSIT